MAYVDPNTIHDPMSSSTPPASWGTTINDDLEYLIEPPFCVCSNTSGQSVADSTNTNLIPHVEEWDLFDMRSPTSNSTRITVPDDGLYMVGIAARFGGSITGYRQITAQFNLSGTPISSALAVYFSNNASTVNLTGNTVQAMSSNDYVEARVFQNSGGALNCELWRFSVRFVARIPT